MKIKKILLPIREMMILEYPNWEPAGSLPLVLMLLPCPGSLFKIRSWLTFSGNISLPGSSTSNATRLQLPEQALRITTEQSTKRNLNGFEHSIVPVNLNKLQRLMRINKVLILKFHRYLLGMNCQQKYQGFPDEFEGKLLELVGTEYPQSEPGGFSCQALLFQAVT